MSRRSQRQPFEIIQGAPAPLAAHAERTVRFQEVDPLGVLWHGHYASYFDDARVAFGDRFGLGYLDMKQQNFAAPIVRLQVDYHNPLRFGETARIETKLHWTEASRLNFEYAITGPDGRVAATGMTVQLLIGADGETLLLRPPYLERLFERWKAGEL